MTKRYLAFDVGHGGSDPGAVNGKRKEADDVLKLAKAIEKYIETNSGGVVDCQKSRTDDKTLSLIDRSNWQKRHPEYEFFVSFHRDSAGSSARGASVHIYNDQRSKNSGKLAKCIEKRLCPILPGRSNTIQEHNFHVLRETTCPAVLIECGFISNSKDNEIFDKKFEDIVKAIGDGIMEYANIKKVDNKPSKPKPQPAKKETYFRVVVGSYKDRKEAENQQKKLKDKGFESFLVAFEK